MDHGMAKMRVIILTPSFKIRGEINATPNERVTDYLLNAKSFVAVTDAEVSTLDGEVVLRAPFIDVQRDRIEILSPEE